MQETNDPGGCGCLGLLLGFGLMAFLGGHPPGGEDGMPPWEALPPPEFLDDPEGSEWYEYHEFFE